MVTLLTAQPLMHFLEAIDLLLILLPITWVFNLQFNHNIKYLNFGVDKDSSTAHPDFFQAYIDGNAYTENVVSHI